MDPILASTNGTFLKKTICFAPFIDCFSIVYFFQWEFKSDSTSKTLLSDNNGGIRLDGGPDF